MTARVEPDDPQPHLSLRAPAGGVTAAVLLLPGGRADSFELAHSRHLAAVRMRPFGWALRRPARGRGLAVGLVRYRYRGWNGEEMSPVADARWALAELRRRHGPVSVVLVGHSMGGRTALRVADDTSVRGVAALAPWVLDGEPVAQLAGRRVLIVHGDRDRVTSPRASRRYADRAADVAAAVDYVNVRGDTHAMLLRFATWQRLTTRFVAQVLNP